MCRRQDHGFFSGRDGESGLVEVAFKACLVGFCVIWNSPWQRCDSMNLTHSNRFPDVHLPLSAFWGKSWRFSDDATTIQASTALWAFFALKIPQRFQLQPLRRRGTGGTNGTVGPCTMVGLLAMQGRCWAMVTALESGHLAVRSITWVNMYEPRRPWRIHGSLSKRGIPVYHGIPINCHWILKICESDDDPMDLEVPNFDPYDDSNSETQTSQFYATLSPMLLPTWVRPQETTSKEELKPGWELTVTAWVRWWCRSSHLLIEPLTVRVDVPIYHDLPLYLAIHLPFSGLAIFIWWIRIS